MVYRRRRSYRRTSGQSYRTQWVRSVGALTATNAKVEANLLRTIATPAPEGSNPPIQVLAGDDTVAAPEDSKILRVHLALHWLDTAAAQSTFYGVCVAPNVELTAIPTPGPKAQANSKGWMSWGVLTPYCNQFKPPGGGAAGTDAAIFLGEKVVDIKSKRIFRESMHTLYLVLEPNAAATGATVAYVSSVLIQIP